jgi:hypothetical protein
MMLKASAMRRPLHHQPVTEIPFGFGRIAAGRKGLIKNPMLQTKAARQII